MPRTAMKPKLRTFYATLQVTRVEEWCVEAESAEQARLLLEEGQGYRCRMGERVHTEIQHVADE
jgi:hypothetical protein